MERKKEKGQQGGEKEAWRKELRRKVRGGKRREEDKMKNTRLNKQ